MVVPVTCFAINGRCSGVFRCFTIVIVKGERRNLRRSETVVMQGKIKRSHL
jgi:hypothetical protein